MAGLEDIGVTLHVPREHRLPSLTTAVIPAGVDDQLVRRRLLEEYSIEIGGGIGDLKGKVWRIGLMAETSRRENVLILLSALERILRYRRGATHRSRPSPTGMTGHTEA